MNDIQLRRRTNTGNDAVGKRRLPLLVLLMGMFFLLVLSGCSEDKNNGERDLEAVEESQTVAETASGDSSNMGDVSDAVYENGELRTAVEEGCLAPDMDLTYVDGSTAKLSDYRGKVVFLNLWATWCGPCVNEMPAFPKLQEEFGDQLQIVAINCGETAQVVRDFAEEKGYTFPMVVDEEYKAMLGSYQTGSIPYTVIIDPEGVIHSIHLGAWDAETMFEIYKADIEEAL